MGVSDKWGEEMSRWIDAEWIRNVYADFEHYDNRNDWTTPIANVLAVIDDAPSIDIVRCKECKWAKANGTYQWCGRLDSTARITADDFCSYGKREGE